MWNQSFNQSFKIPHILEKIRASVPWLKWIPRGSTAATWKEESTNGYPSKVLSFFCWRLWYSFGLRVHCAYVGLTCFSFLSQYLMNPGHSAIPFSQGGWSYSNSDLQQWDTGLQSYLHMHIPHLWICYLAVLLVDNFCFVVFCTCTVFWIFVFCSYVGVAACFSRSWIGVPEACTCACTCDCTCVCKDFKNHVRKCTPRKMMPGRPSMLWMGASLRSSAVPSRVLEELCTFVFCTFDLWYCVLIPLCLQHVLYLCGVWCFENKKLGRMKPLEAKLAFKPGSHRSHCMRLVDHCHHLHHFHLLRCLSQVVLHLLRCLPEVVALHPKHRPSYLLRWC